MKSKLSAVDLIELLFYLWVKISDKEWREANEPTSGGYVANDIREKMCSKSQVV